MLKQLNSHLVGQIGLAGGGVSIVAAVTYWFKVLSDPNELVALYVAAKTHTDPTHAIANLIGASIAIVGAFTVSLVAAWLGRPTTV